MASLHDCFVMYRGSEHMEGEENLMMGLDEEIEKDIIKLESDRRVRRAIGTELDEAVYDFGNGIQIDEMANGLGEKQESGENYENEENDENYQCWCGVVHLAKMWTARIFYQNATAKKYRTFFRLFD